MKRNLIEDSDLLEGLRRIGFRFQDSPTYDDAVNWFREKKSIIITIYPQFGEKIEYDTYRIYGWSSEIMAPYNGGVYLCDDEFDKFARSYRYTIKPGEQKDPEHPRIFSSYKEALENAVRDARIYYIALNKSDFWDGYRKKLIIPSPPEWPKYIAFEDRDEWLHSFYILEKPGKYKRWEKDEFDFKDSIEVIFDGKEFLVSRSNFTHHYGHKVQAVSEIDLIRDLFKRNNDNINGITFEDVLKSNSYSDWI